MGLVSSVATPNGPTSRSSAAAAAKAYSPAGDWEAPAGRLVSDPLVGETMHERHRPALRHRPHLKCPTTALAWRPTQNVTVPPIPTNTCSALASLASQSPPKMQSAGLRQLPSSAVPAMDDFPDGAFVRLENREKGTYLHADEDGEGVSLRPQGSPNVVWRVHHVLIDGTTFVLLQGAAYGRYLAISPFVAPSGYRGRSTVQRDYGGANVGALMWRPLRITGDERYIRLRHEFNHNLRANGRYRTWHTAVTAEINVNEGSWSTMMQWTVHGVPLAPGLPPLPRPSVILGARSSLFRRRRPEADRGRLIRHVRADDEGNFDQNFNNWPTFPFYGRSVFNLRVQVGMRQPGAEVLGGITLAVRPGIQGRLTPLVTDLPRSGDTMDIVVFNTGSQGAQNLVYPEIA